MVDFLFVDDFQDYPSFYWQNYPSPKKLASWVLSSPIKGGFQFIGVRQNHPNLQHVSIEPYDFGGSQILENLHFRRICLARPKLT